MAKYIIDIPDSEETMWEGFNGDLFIPITMNKGTKTWVNTDLKMTPYTEPDEREIRKRIINEVCNKFLATNYYYGDDIKQVLWRMKDGEIAEKMREE